MKEAPSVTQHFANIDEALALFDTDTVSDELRKYFFLDGVEWLWTAEGSLVPSITASFSSPYLYRGQVHRYQPCVPSVFRGLPQAATPQELSPVERARLFVDRIRLEEFRKALDTHPASDYAREIGLRMHPFALAQHYELATDRVDLTQDHRVAAFFATNTRREGAWLPVKSGIGVVYRLQRSVFSKHMSEHLECIGKQALPRPGEQKAYTLRLPLGCDFERLPVETYTFDQHECSGQKLHDAFAGGSMLFPHDVMAEVAHSIRKNNTLPLEVARELVLSDRVAPDQNARILDNVQMQVKEHLGLRIVERRPIALTESQRSEAHDAVEGMRQDFLRGVGVLAVRRAQ